MDRAYSVLTAKSFTEDDEFVYLEGIASTPTTDRMGDIVEPMGAEFVTPMKMLLHHVPESPVGNMTFARPQASGIPFKGRLPIIRESGRVKDRVDEAIHSLKYDLISAVSIGFKPVEGQVERLKTGGLRFKKWLWYELSLVTIPANADAVITAVKSIDHEHLASAGRAGDRVAPSAAKAVALTSTAKRGNITITKR